MSDSNFDTDIAVVGMAGRFAGARNLDEFWNNLRDGVESLTTLQRRRAARSRRRPGRLLPIRTTCPSGAVLPDMEMFDARVLRLQPARSVDHGPAAPPLPGSAPGRRSRTPATCPQRFDGSIGVFGGSGHNAYMPYNLLTNPKLMAAVGLLPGAPHRQRQGLPDDARLLPVQPAGGRASTCRPPARPRSWPSTWPCQSLLTASATWRWPAA